MDQQDLSSSQSSSEADHPAFSLYPPISPKAGAAETLLHPYFDLPPETRQSPKTSLDFEDSNERSEFEKDSDDDYEDDADGTEPLDGVPHDALLERQDVSSSFASSYSSSPSEEDADDDSGDDSESEGEAEGGAAAARENASNEVGNARGTLNAGRGGRARGRGRGRPRGYGLGPGSRGGTVRPRGGPRGRPRGSVRSSRGEGSLRRGGGKGSKRGPQQAMEPTDEFKTLLRKATVAFLAKSNEEALENVQQAIWINPEIFAAHSLLSEIYAQMDMNEESLSVLWSGAHTQREATVWWDVARRTEALSSADERVLDEQLMYCYSRILQYDPNDVGARRAKLDIYMKADLPYLGKAIYAVKGMLKARPHDLGILQTLAQLCVEASEPHRARGPFDETINHLMDTHPDGKSSQFSFSDLNIYSELWLHAAPPQDPRARSRLFEYGLVRLKEVARWICGRKSESYWDRMKVDDREWDIDDKPRRVELPGFVTGQYPAASYGEALPLEIRAKMGIFRLKYNSAYLSEAMNHFGFLQPEETGPEATVADYPDTFREVADALYTSGFYEQALRFYKPLAINQSKLEEKTLVNIAQSNIYAGRFRMAISEYEKLITEYPERPQYLLQLAKIHDHLGDADAVKEYADRLIYSGESELLNQAKLKTQNLLARPAEGRVQPPTPRPLRPAATPRPPRALSLPGLRSTAEIQNAYNRILYLRTKMYAGDDPEAEDEFILKASFLIQDFQKVRYLYPSTDRGVPIPFETYVQRFASVDPTAPGTPPQMPSTTSFCGISFASWLGLFCEHAFLSARRLADKDAAYATLEAAKNANVFYHNPEHLMHIYVCWLSCALMLSDESTLVAIARWFMKTFAGASDAYRLYAALHRLFNSTCMSEPTEFYNSVHQKYLMRQIRMMDYTILGKDDRQRLRGGQEQRKSDVIGAGNLFGEGSLDDHEPVIMLLYGHLLCAHGRYASALNYYFRALAVRPGDPFTLLSIAIAYCLEAMKRTMQMRRHDTVLRGVAFFNEYKKARLEANVHGWDKLSEETRAMIRRNRIMEVEFNEGRLWHLMGLAGLAVPAYERCLAVEEGQAGKPESTNVGDDAHVGEEREAAGEARLDDDIEYEPGFKREAAFALQQIYALSGDLTRAREITEQWLVF